MLATGTVNFTPLKMLELQIIFTIVFSLKLSSSSDVTVTCILRVDFDFSHIPKVCDFLNFTILTALTLLLSRNVIKVLPETFSTRLIYFRIYLKEVSIGFDPIGTLPARIFILNLKLANVYIKKSRAQFNPIWLHKVEESCNNRHHYLRMFVVMQNSRKVNHRLLNCRKL